MDNTDSALSEVLEKLLTGHIDTKSLKKKAKMRSAHFSQSNIKEFEYVINED